MQEPRGRRPKAFVVEVPSHPHAIEAAVGYLVSRLVGYGFAGSRLDLNFRVGVTEALANAVIYGNRSDPRKLVRVDVHLDSVRVDVTVTDQGAGFDPERVADPTLPENLERTGGRGIFLLRKLMDEVEFNSRGNQVRLVLFRRGLRLTG